MDASPDTRTLRLPDGRRLAYDDVGDPDGLPMLYLHPFAASRRQRHPDDLAAAAAGIRLIAADRPGIGGSDRVPGRAVADWVRDLRALADELGLRRFLVLGWSAGGAYALACGCALAERVIAVGLASPAAGWFVGRGAQPDVRLDRRRLRAVAGATGWWIRMLSGEARRRVRSNPEGLVGEESRSLPPCDREILARSEIRRMMGVALREQFRQGFAGMVDEALALARPWGFDPARVAVPVLLWQGESDTVVSAGAVRRLAARLPSCRATFYAGEGHYLVLARWRQILGALTAAAGGG